MASGYWLLGYLFLHCRLWSICSKAIWCQTEIFTHPITLKIAQTSRFLVIWNLPSLHTHKTSPLATDRTRLQATAALLKLSDMLSSWQVSSLSPESSSALLPFWVTTPQEPLDRFLLWRASLAPHNTNLSKCHPVKLPPHGHIFLLDQFPHPSNPLYICCVHVNEK